VKLLLELDFAELIDGNRRQPRSIGGLTIPRELHNRAAAESIQCWRKCTLWNGSRDAARSKIGNRIVGITQLAQHCGALFAQERRRRGPVAL
jgi:hypothetical protein